MKCLKDLEGPRKAPEGAPQNYPSSHNSKLLSGPFSQDRKMASFTLSALEERIKALEELQNIQETNDNSINQV